PSLANFHKAVEAVLMFGWNGEGPRLLGDALLGLDFPTEYVQVACDRVLVTRNRRIFAFLALIAFSAANRRPPSGQARGQAFSGTCARHRMSMRALLGVFIGLAGIAAVIAAAAFAAAKYMTWVPGTPHTGALPPLTAEEGALAGRLRQHIEAIGSRPHNIDHFD